MTEARISIAELAALLAAIFRRHGCSDIVAQTLADNMAAELRGALSLTARDRTPVQPAVASRCFSSAITWSGSAAMVARSALAGPRSGDALKEEISSMYASGDGPSFGGLLFLPQQRYWPITLPP